jgi:hypothetical protein
MVRECCVLILVIFGTISLMFSPSGSVAGPKGAKAIFDSGEGPSVSMSLDQTQVPSSSAAPVQQEKYVGISYQLMLLSDDGQFSIVPKSRVFKSGERIKLLVRTNRPGYMTIFNVGPTGNTNLLFNEYVEALGVREIPKNTNFRFVGPRGTERVLIMLSNEPNPMVQQPPMASGTGGIPQQAGFPPAPPPSGTEGAFPPSPSASLSPPPSDMAYLPPPPPVQSVVASIEGSKGLKGSKDIVAEDNMSSSYTVISPRNNYKPIKTGMKDIVLESSTGNNYGVIPASNLAGGGILTLEVKLEHL